jgi:hypothetical protein
MRWEGNVARIGENRNIHKILIEKLEEEDNIRTDLYGEDSSDSGLRSVAELPDIVMSLQVV